MAKFFNSVGPLRGLKGQSYEGGLRVPGIVRFPGKVEAGSTSDRVTGFEDWTPTLLSMTGAAATSWADCPARRPSGRGRPAWRSRSCTGSRRPP